MTVYVVRACIVPTTLADIIEREFASVTLEMTDGATAPRTHEVARELEAPGHPVMMRLGRERPVDGDPLLSDATVTVGQGPRLKGGVSVPSPPSARRRISPQSNSSYSALSRYRSPPARLRRLGTKRSEYCLT